MSRYSAIQFWEEAVVDLNLPSYETTHRLNLINSSVDSVFQLIHGFFGQYYTRQVPLQAQANGKINSGTGSYAYSTKQLTMTTMTNGTTTVGFSVADEGRKAVMRVGGNVWECVIDDYISSTVVQLAGNGLPSSNQTVDSFFIINSVHAVDGIILLTDLRVNALSTVKISLESTASNYVDALSIEDFKRWSTTNMNNRNRIAYCYEGNQLMCKIGSSLTNLGSMTLHYPSMPTVVTATTSTVDIPDGIPVLMGIEYLKAKILHREGQIKDMTPQLAKFRSLFGELKSNFGLEVEAEKDKDKIQAII